MPRRNQSDQLDEALAVTIHNPGASPRLDRKLTALLEIASELHGLPRPEFKNRLKSELLSESAAAARPAIARGGKPLLTNDDIMERLAEMEREPKIVAYDVYEGLRMPEHAMRFFTSLNQCTVGVSHSTRQATNWERHPAGDELLYILDGELDITTLTEAGPVRTRVRKDSIFVCPQGLWHWPRPNPHVAMLFATAGEGIEHSGAKDPRRNGKGPATLYRTAPPKDAHKPKLKAHDVRAVLDEAPLLAITSETTGEQADAAYREIGILNRCHLGLMKFSGLTPWERHPGGDELLFALDGEVDITVLTDAGPERETVRAGSVFVCPQGLWHRQFARDRVAVLYGTETETSEHSFADDPRSAD